MIVSAGEPNDVGLGRSCGCSQCYFRCKKSRSPETCARDCDCEPIYAAKHSHFRSSGTQISCPSIFFSLHFSETQPTIRSISILTRLVVLAGEHNIVELFLDAGPPSVASSIQVIRTSNLIKCMQISSVRIY
jgi:hypothetical protein